MTSNNFGLIKTAITWTTWSGIDNARTTTTTEANRIPNTLDIGRSFNGFTKVNIPTIIRNTEVNRLLLS